MTEVKRERRAQVALSQEIWDFLDEESGNTKVPVTNLISLYTTERVREIKKERGL